MIYFLYYNSKMTNSFTQVLSNNINTINWNNLSNDETKLNLLIPKNPEPLYKINWTKLF